MNPEDLIAVVPAESAVVVIGALFLAIAIVWLLAILGSRYFPPSGAPTEASLRIPGINIVLKGKGRLMAVVILFVLIVILYALLRITPGTP
jgi:hypothetical protein